MGSRAARGKGRHGVSRARAVLLSLLIATLGSFVAGPRSEAAAAGCTDVSGWSLTDRLNPLIMVSGSCSDLSASGPYASAGIGAFVMYGQPAAGSGPTISSGVAALYNDA